jgi:hypothetical protein
MSTTLDFYKSFKCVSTVFGTAEHYTFLRLFQIYAKEQTLRDPFDGLAPMLKLASARKSLLNLPKFSLSLYLELVPRICISWDPRSLSKYLGIPSFLSSKRDLFMNIQGLNLQSRIFRGWAQSLNHNVYISSWDSHPKFLGCN